MNPTPVLTSVSPSGAQSGGGNFYLTATGSSFVPGAVLLWNGSERTTAFIDSAHLKVAIPAADIASPGTATLTVVNPGSAPSGPVFFQIH
jgi:trimeric autotransporter adhesin